MAARSFIGSQNCIAKEYRARLVRVAIEPGSYVRARLTWDRLSAYNIVMFG